ncbi:MAG: hypothetical protein ACI8VC_000075 [Candidatus Endobugula sp.]
MFIDNATSQLMAFKLSPSETSSVYGNLTGLLPTHGRPVALYSDKHSMFRVNCPNKEGEITQFTCAMKNLDVALFMPTHRKPNVA